jgi:hypothetical protein
VYGVECQVQGWLALEARWRRSWPVGTFVEMCEMALLAAGVLMVVATLLHPSRQTATTRPAVSGLRPSWSPGCMGAHSVAPQDQYLPRRAPRGFPEKSETRAAPFSLSEIRHSTVVESTAFCRFCSRRCDPCTSNSLPIGTSPSCAGPEPH